MPLYFMIFLGTLVAALLLYLGATAQAAFTRKPASAFIPEHAMVWLQAAGLALLWFSVGIAWLLFFNVYRIHVDMSAVGDAALQAFSRGYTRRLPIVVLPFGAACLAWTLALWGTPVRISRWAVWGIATLCVVSILSTPWAAFAHDDMQAHGYTEAAYRQLQTFHLVRTIAFTIAAVWALVERR
ncbi:MAG: hypothetical protein J0I77_08095 [Rudaea sp.]|uniref:hypothetical protein n=1 Tax=unclassified Rudaea TaxID=2627037 RepID=UPI0010F7D395|nr:MULTISPECIES: hypothetical protein [unclassified Rudaea]MBN8885668.1 hypothetical protein [Rudaea sp.]MBR0346380.1 hypothetical protein [Rudaea sp.]